MRRKDNERKEENKTNKKSAKKRKGQLYVISSTSNKTGRELENKILSILLAREEEREGEGYT